ncbi:MAG: protein kinase, partial [Gemmatimonadales bacterium]
CALQHAHQQGIILRDIKPENVLLSGGHAVVADFGIARAVDAARRTGEQPVGSGLTAIGFVVGTPAYMSPEQATASGVDARTDQYALGCVTYEMVTGVQPFSGPTVHAVLAQSLTGPRPRVTKLVRDAPAEADQVLAKAMDSDPSRRFESVDQFAEALSRSAGGGTEALSERRRLRVAVGALAAALILAVTGWAVFGRGAGGSPVIKEAESIAVLPFSASGAGVDLMGEGMVDLLSTNLNSVGGIRAVEPRLVLARWRKVEGRALDVAGALGLARSVSANSVVLGSIVGTGSRVRISAALHGPDGSVLANAQVDGAQDSVLDLVDDLSAGLVRAIWKSKEPVPTLRVSGITTNSLEAMRAYLEGERAFRRSRWTDAQAAFHRAVEVDSTFSLAYLREAVTLGWMGSYGSQAARVAAAAALRFAERLPERERALVVGYGLFSEGRTAAIDSMRSYVTRYPDDIDGWYVYADALVHARALNGLSAETLREPFDRVLALDSSLAPAAIHPAELTLANRDTVNLKRYIALMREAGSDEQADEFAAGLELLGRGLEDTTLIARLGPRQGTVSAAMIAITTRPGLGSDSVIAAASKGWMQSGAAGAAGGSQYALARSTLHASLGRFDEAYRIADSLRKTDQPMGWNAILTPLMLGIAPPGFAAGDRERILAAPRTNPFQVYAVVQVMVTLGDLDLASRLVDSVLGAPAVTADTTRSGSYLRGGMTAVKGQIALERGDTTGGLGLLQGGLREAGVANLFLTAGQRLAYARTLAARPATREQGIRLLENGFESDFGAKAYTRLLLGRALEAAGDRGAAVRNYSEFLRLWDKADPDARAWVTEAGLAVRRLTSEAQELR